MYSQNVLRRQTDRQTDRQSDEAGRPNAAEFLDFGGKDSLYNYRSVMFKLYQKN